MTQDKRSNLTFGGYVFFLIYQVIVKFSFAKNVIYIIIILKQNKKEQKTFQVLKVFQ